jgi:hypothetical protein
MIGDRTSKGEHRAGGYNEAVSLSSCQCDIVNLHAIALRISSTERPVPTHSGLGQVVSVSAGVTPKPFLAAALVCNTETSEAMLVAGRADMVVQAVQ